MATPEGEFTRFETRIFRSILILVPLLYAGMLALPWLSFFLFPTLRDSAKLTRILGQLGTYGDMFGALNSLVTGIALLGVVYTSILQRKQFDLAQQQLKLQRREIARDKKDRIRDKRDRIRADRRQRRSALLEATSQLVRIYSDEYAVNKQLHDNEHNYAVEVTSGNRERVEGPFTEPAKTLKGKLIAARDVLEGMYMAEMNHHGDFFINLVENRKRD